MQKDRKRISKQQSIIRREQAATVYVIKHLSFTSPYLILAANNHLTVARQIQNFQ